MEILIATKAIWIRKLLLIYFFCQNTRECWTFFLLLLVEMDLMLLFFTRYGVILSGNCTCIAEITKATVQCVLIGKCPSKKRGVVCL